METDGGRSQIDASPRSQMWRARVLIAVSGVAWPYVAILLFSPEHTKTLAVGGLEDQLAFGLINAVAWGALLLLSFAYRYPASLAAPSLAGLLASGWGYADVGTADGNHTAMMWVVIPFATVVPILIGGLIGLFVDAALRRLWA